MADPQLKPRQKMINLIYLVLTAILALNVSGEVLDAFKTVNDGIDNSNTSLRNKNAGIYTDFSTQFKNDSARADNAYKKAQQARASSSGLYDQLEQYKKQMIAEAGGIDIVTGKIKHDDNMDISTRIFVENGGKKGKQLAAQIAETRARLITLLDENERKDAESSLPLTIDSPAEGKSWEFAHFNQVPVVAAVTLLTKYQNDLLSAEGQVVEKLYSSVYKKVDKVDRLCARVISPSSYVLQGESYKADVMVAAYNSTQDPEVFIGQFTPAVKKDGNGNFIMTTSKSDAVPLLNPVKINVEQGLGKLTMPGNATGNTKYSGVIRVKTTDGDYKFFPFEGEYQVGEKTAVVSPQKMNVLYVGLDNPVDISVPGVAQKDIIAVFDGDGRLVQNSDGSFKALVSKPGNTKVKVSARVDGKVIAMGEKAFRIKRVPNPVTTLDGILQSGSARGTMLEQRTGVVAKSDEFVYGDIPWQVKRYTVTIHKGTELQKIDNVGAALCTKARELMKGLKKGDAVFIDDVIAAGPDKNDRKIGSLAFNITMQ